MIGGQKMNENKKADNIIINNKKRINEIDDELSEQKKKLKKLDSMQEDVASLTRNIDKCIQLLSKSIQGPTTQNMFNDMSNTNQLFLRKTNNNIEEETMKAQHNIHKLYQEKDQILKENRDRLNKEREETQKEQK